MDAPERGNLRELLVRPRLEVVVRHSARFPRKTSPAPRVEPTTASLPPLHEGRVGAARVEHERPVDLAHAGAVAQRPATHGTLVRGVRPLDVPKPVDAESGPKRRPRGVCRK